MVTKAQRIKAIVKNPEPARGKSGTDPLDPWGAKAGIAEASEEQLLRAYLKSRGINPDYVPRDTKIAHSKSSAYLSWRKNHEFRESVDKEDTITFDIPLLIRMFEYAREDAKTDMDLHKVTEKLISIRDKGTLTMADYDYIVKLKEEYNGQILEWTNSVQAQKKSLLKGSGPKPTALDKWRDAAAERAKKHAEIQKNSGGMTSAIDRLEKHLNKEEACCCDSKKEWSKSARIIKSIYKRKNMKEETYDWEKDDKAQTYGKKPKISNLAGQENMDQKKPDARIIMSGGKTMTGDKRDTVEVDPLMNKPSSNQPDYFEKPTSKKDH